jgi:6-phosphogluconolactonase
MIEAEWWDYDDMDELAEAVAGDVGFIIESALDARGQALIALPGGKTPLPIYEKLAAAPIKWKHVTIIPTDDRLVAVDNPLSNVAMLAKAFMPKGARVLPIATENKDHKAAGNAADARLQDLHWPPDLVWLGVGADGHTASIFAGPDMEDALNAPKARRAVGVLPDPLPPEAPVARVTLTRHSILSARTLLMVLTGADKRALVEQAIKDGPLSPLPVGRVLADAEQAFDIHWCA